jgi:hypothetical protein
MQRKQVKVKGWKKFGLVVLYGVGAPALSYTMAALGADVAHVMPKPVNGDWKIAVGIAAAIVVVSTISSVISRISARAH